MVHYTSLVTTYHLNVKFIFHHIQLLWLSYMIYKLPFFMEHCYEIADPILFGRKL